MSAKISAVGTFTGCATEEQRTKVRVAVTDVKSKLGSPASSASAPFALYVSTGPVTPVTARTRCKIACSQRRLAKDEGTGMTPTKCRHRWTAQGEPGRQCRCQDQQTWTLRQRDGLSDVAASAFIPYSDVLLNAIFVTRTN